MTVSSTTNIIVYEGNGATTIWSYDFLIPEQADAVITYTDADGVETVLNTNQYSITGLDDTDGGTVTYPLSGSPIANGTFLSIRRELPLVQTTDLVNQDGFYPQVVEDALDYLTMLIQQINTTNSQAIRVPASENPPDELPAAAVRAGQQLIFDSEGQPTVGAPADATVSAAMQPVVAAATLVSARTLLGVAYLPVAVSTNQTVALADITTRYMATGALTFTMPDSTQVPAGFCFDVYALTGNCTLDPVGTDTIFGYSIGANATVAAGTIVNIVTDGAGNWWPATIISTEDFVGSIRPYGGFEVPSAKYVLCDGTSYLRADYPAAFAILSMAVTATKTNGSPVLGGFTSAQTAKLGLGMRVEGTGIPAGSRILTDSSSGDTSITIDQNATNSLTQTVTIVPYDAADTTHFKVPDLRGRAPAGAELATNAASRLTPSYFGLLAKIGNPGGLESHTLTTAQLAAHTHTATQAAHTHTPATNGQGGSLQTGVDTLGGSSPVLGGGLTLNNATPAITVQNAGGGTGHNNVQPTLVINYLIRVLP